MSGNISKIPDIVVGDIRIFTKGTNVNLRSEPNTTSKVIATVAATGTEIGKYAKYYANDGSSFMYKWYEFSGGKYGNGWIRNDLATLTTTATTVPTAKNDDAEAQQLLDDIVAQDKETMNNLNNAAALIETLKTKGVSTTASANRLTAIFTRLQERQEAMKKTTWGKVKDTISNAWGSVKKFFGFSGMGILPIVIIAGIALVAGAGTTALVMIKPWKNQSNIDLKESRELKELLENADPVVAQKIREDIKTQLVDAYTTGNRQGSVSSFMSIGKYVLIAGAALWLAPKLMDFLGKTARK
jgi:SH3-like domain-containing protein